MDVKELMSQLEKDPPRRFLSITREKVDKENRTIDLSFSSELPIVRWYGIEILDHAPGCMRMTRGSGDGLPLLFNHNRDTLLGRLTNVRCDDEDRMGRGTARFDDAGEGADRFRQVENGMLKDVSVGYQVHHMEEMDPKKMDPGLMEMAAREKLPVYRITDWEPFECSMVTVPADPTVGVGRAAGAGNERPRAQEISANAINASGSEAPTSERKEVSIMDSVTKTLEEHEADIRKAREDAAKSATQKEQDRVNGIHELGRRFHNFVPQFVVDKAVREATPLEDFQKLVLARVENGDPVHTPDSELGLSAKEIKRYSISRAIMSQVQGERVDASFERACHEELVKRGVSPVKGGILVPLDIRRQHADPKGTGQRDLSIVGGDAVGGYLKGTDHLGSEFIDVLRNAMVLRRAGARVLSGLRGNVAIPKRTAGASSYWVAETAAPTEGANTFAQLALSPKCVGGFIDYTRELLLQSNPSIDGLVNGDLALSIATAIDLAGFHGTGADGQPQGIVGTSGVGATTATAVDFSKMLDFQTDVAAANALSGSCAYITTPAVAAILAAKPRFTYATFGLWVGGILESADACGFRGYATNQITAGYMIFGDFSQVIIGEWGTLELLVNPFVTSSTRIIRVTAFQSVDVGLRYPAAFSVATSVTAA